MKKLSAKAFVVTAATFLLLIVCGIGYMSWKLELVFVTWVLSVIGGLCLFLILGAIKKL
jgi:hypothetical protein